MPKTDLTALLGNLRPDDPLLLPERRNPTSTPALAEASAGYLRFVRKDTRLREEQLEALTLHARRLNRAKRGAGVRITENTLIRVAVDLLLDRIESVSAVDESSLLGAVRR